MNTNYIATQFVLCFKICKMSNSQTTNNGFKKVEQEIMSLNLVNSNLALVKSFNFLLSCVFTNSLKTILFKTQVGERKSF